MAKGWSECADEVRGRLARSPRVREVDRTVGAVERAKLPTKPGSSTGDWLVGGSMLDAGVDYAAGSVGLKFLPLRVLRVSL